MRFLTSLLASLLAFPLMISAEGTHELAPNGSIVINGNTTTDLAALHINNPTFNAFAAFDNPDPHSRLYIHVADPAKECIYLGFSFGHLNVTSQNPTRVDYQYRVKDPAGNIVFGPVIVPKATANIQNWSQGFTGPMEIHGAGGFDADEVSSAALASQGWSGAGDYYVEFESLELGADFLIDFWDITVADCSVAPVAEKKGRIWSYNWSIFAVNDFGFPNRPFNGAFYVCAPDPDDADAAFITKIDFNGSGFRPAAFNIAFNSFGIQNTGDIAEDRKSVELTNATQSEYAIFLNDPIELCKTAVVGEIELVGIGRCDAGDYCIKFTTTKEGQIDLLLDFDGGDGEYTAGTRDVLIPHFVLPGEVGIPSCIDWDGLDGLGNPLPEDAATQIPVIIYYAQGIYHFPIYDAELMTSGFMLEAVRPAASIPLLHYDDSKIDVVSGSGEPPVQISGCNVPCHRWSTFVNNTVPGFGNLHTINSWWFSQRIVRQEVLFLPAYYTCEVDGPQSICSGSTTQIAFQPQVHPAGLTGPEVISTIWSGPGIIGSNSGNVITIGSEGTYTVDVLWISGIGDTCSASCDYHLSIDPPLTASIDTLILEGEVIHINGEAYSEGGQYVQELTTINGCDSILTINVQVLNTVIYNDLNACWSFMSDGSHMDYSEFTASIPQPLACADISAGIIFRDPPQMNKHSCTDGVNGSIAMCISAQDTCDYDAGNQASLVFEVTITPDPDTAVQLTGFSFFEKGPLTFAWISGDTGPNNYPTLFGIRVLKNGVEIFRQEDIATTPNWTERVFDFLGDDEFIVGSPAVFRFELLPYCLIGNGAAVAAWDIDEIKVQASCVSISALDKIISGTVKTPKGSPVHNVEMRLSHGEAEPLLNARLTDEAGDYLFSDVRFGKNYYVTGYKNTNFKDGVSTIDLIHIQRHLLGVQLFDSPYKYIAADANRSNDVSAIDLIELRKLILGVYTELPHNTSWRLGNVDEVFHSGHPWSFKESIEIESLEEEIHDADFVGVKIGDINGTASGFTSSLEERSNETLQLHMTDHVLEAGVPYKLVVTGKNFNNVIGFQVAMSFSDIQILEIKPGAISLGKENAHITADGVLRLSWNDVKALNIADDAVLFTITIISSTSGHISDFLQSDHESLTPEAYLGDDLHTAKLEFIFSKQTINPAEYKLFQNEPNPFSSNTTIRFQLARAGNATLSFYNVSGQLIREIKGDFEKGIQSVDISNKELGIQKGVFICQLQSERYSESIKMILF